MDMFVLLVLDVFSVICRNAAARDVRLRQNIPLVQVSISVSFALSGAFNVSVCTAVPLCSEDPAAKSLPACADIGALPSQIAILSFASACSRRRRGDNEV